MSEDEKVNERDDQRDDPIPEEVHARAEKLAKALLNTPPKPRVTDS